MPFLKEDVDFHGNIRDVRKMMVEHSYTVLTHCGKTGEGMGEFLVTYRFKEELKDKDDLIKTH